MTSPIQENDSDGIIDMDDYSSAQDQNEMEGIIDMSEYSNSKESEEASWWNTAKDAGIQGALGLSQAFTWPLDVLKLSMIGEGLSDIDEVEEAYQKAGKTFDKNKYIKTVMEGAEFIPTQELLEKQITKHTGIDLEPKTEIGKGVKKFFFLSGLMRGKGLLKAVTSGAIGAGTTAGLRAAGAPEIVSELGGDIASGLSSIEKQARQLTPELENIVKTSEKHGLPLMEVMLKDELPIGPKITQGRKAAFEKELGMSTEEALNKIIENKIPISKLRAQGKDLQVLESEAYEKAKSLAKLNDQPLNTKDIISEIDGEISRIRARAPSPSDAENAAIRILEREKEVLSAATPNTEQLVNQTTNYNSNVKSIYRKSEFSGVEDEVKNAYAFLNNTIRNTIENQAGSEVADAYKIANKIYAENAMLARTEGIIAKSFKDGNYNPKKLNDILNSKQGAFLRRDLGEQGVNELKDIAKYGQIAQKATTQYANSSKYKFNVSEWGPLAGFLLAKAPPAGVAAATVKPMYDYIRGWALTRPAARTVYRDILKNATNGSFKNMSKDFAKLQNEIVKEYGSMDDFIKSGIQEIEFYTED